MITPKGYVHNGKYGVMVCANVVSESGAGGSMCARGPALCPESSIRGPTCDHTLHSSLYYTIYSIFVKCSSCKIRVQHHCLFTDFKQRRKEAGFEMAHGCGGPTITKSGHDEGISSLSRNIRIYIIQLSTFTRFSVNYGTISNFYLKMYALMYC